MTNTRKIIYSIPTLALLVMLLTLIVASPASAACVSPTYDPETGQQTSIGDANEGDCAKNTAFEFNGKTEDVGINDLVVTILTTMSVLVGVAVVGGVITGGIVYSSASGSPAGVEKGRKIIANAILGLILYILMLAIMNFLIPGGILT